MMKLFEPVKLSSVAARTVVFVWQSVSPDLKSAHSNVPFFTSPERTAFLAISAARTAFSPMPPSTRLPKTAWLCGVN
jgi:hypothetical protein